MNILRVVVMLTLTRYHVYIKEVILCFGYQSYLDYCTVYFMFTGGLLIICRLCRVPLSCHKYISEYLGYRNGPGGIAGYTLWNVDHHKVAHVEPTKLT